MILWNDIVSIVFVCVTANHLGLVKAIEDMTDHELLIINCPKCFSFWSVLAYSLFVSRDVITSFAVSFLSSYAAIWLELIEGIIDNIYNIIYDKVYSTENQKHDR